jgi:carbonic anhydrase/acetyltransferase-like protein (isoleucine patch superfamily)
MLLSHDGKHPRVHESAYIAPNATICGDVTIGARCRIMFGACLIAEGEPIVIGDECVVMEHAVIRSTDQHRMLVGNHCLIGPQAHLVGCTLDDCVFIATGATVLHGARLRFNVEVRVNAVVHIRTELADHTVVPIGWIAVGTPATVLPPDQHDAIWAVQKELDFPRYVYGVTRAPQGQTNMREITARRSESLARHASDQVLP